MTVPYSTSAIHATATLRAVSDTEAQTFLGPAANAPLVGSGGQLIAGTVSWQKPPTSDGYYSVYVIDKRTHFGVAVHGGAQLERFRARE